MTTKVKLEADNGNDKDKKCPPGMTLKDGDCVPAGNGDKSGETKNIEENNCGISPPEIVNASPFAFTPSLIGLCASADP